MTADQHKAAAERIGRGVAASCAVLGDPPLWVPNRRPGDVARDAWFVGRLRGVELEAVVAAHHGRLALRAAALRRMGHKVDALRRLWR